MEKRQPRQPARLTVTEAIDLTPNMRRITLTGDALNDYPEITSTAYVKLMFDLQGQALTTSPESRDNVQMRTYTIRTLDQTNATMTIDMALHSEGVHGGPASHWAQHVQPGDSILVGGPGSSKGLADEFDWVLFAGDMTSLPAISTYLESLPADTKGYAVVQITSADDKQVLTKPDGIELIWISDNASSLYNAVSQLTWFPGKPAVWAACEFSAMRELRQLFRNERGVSHEQLYISSYWREGRSEDQHKIDKRKDAEAFDAV